MSMPAMVQEEIQPYGGLVVSEQSFRYLLWQRGSIQHLQRDRRAWMRAYVNGVADAYEGMRPFLPPTCSAILDIGAGLGGIDVFLTRHYVAAKQEPPLVILLDGEDDNPRMVRHKITFGSRKVALQFQRDNGVTKTDYIAPESLRVRKVDLVVSTGAWCFHFGPEHYLAYVLRCCNPGATIITDVRNDADQWLAHLLQYLEAVDIITVAEKRTRRVFRVK